MNKRTRLTSSSRIIIGLFFLCCLLTPSFAETSSKESYGQVIPPGADDSVSEANNSHNNDIFNSTMIESLVPTQPPSSAPQPSLDHSANTTTPKAYTPEAKQDYEISTSNKFLVFIFGAVVFVSVLLLIRNNRVHSLQLAELRREQQERRERDQSRRQEALQDRRNKKFVQRFHCMVISEDGSNAFQAESNVLSAKQGAKTIDVEAPAPEKDNDVAKDEKDTAAQRECVERRPSSSGNHFFHFWKKHPEAANECSICLGDYCPGDTICVAKAAKCNHVFHQDCIAEWIKKSDCCPLCRVDLMTT